MSDALRAQLQESLGDLGEFGIHLNHRRGICRSCNQQIDPQYSDGFHIDARCEGCTKQQGGYGNDPAYSPDTVYVVKGFSRHTAQFEWNAYVKIDGELYLATMATGSSYHLNNVDTDEEVHSFALSLSSADLQNWYELQPVTTAPAFVIQFMWVRVKEAVAHEFHKSVNPLQGIPFYDLGHNGRGMDEYMQHYLRLYLVPTDSWSDREYDVVAVQFEKGSDAPYLPQFQVSRFNQEVAILRWDQAEENLTKAMFGVTNGYFLSALERTLERGALLASRGVLPTNYWITLILSSRGIRLRDRDMEHELDHLIILPRE